MKMDVHLTNTYGIPIIGDPHISTNDTGSSAKC